MIDGTFAGISGIGPAREKELLLMGIRAWADFPASGEVLSPGLDRRIREAIAQRMDWLETGDWHALAGALPTREHWRLLPHLEAQACYLDIETGWDGRTTVIGCYDPARGPRLYVRGWNLGDFVREPPPELLVTFNGASFDLPVLRRTFPAWRAPPLHVDLRVVTRQLDERGGLKAIEARMGLARPDHLDGVDGGDALVLWERFLRGRDATALAKLAEYNLYDVVQLRSVAQIAAERLAARSGRSWSPAQPFRRGDVLYDMTRCVAELVAQSGRMTPDQLHDEERHVLRSTP